MTRVIDSIVKAVIGPGHAMEDANPIPVPFRVPAAAPVMRGSSSEEPVEAKVPIDSDLDIPIAPI